MGKGRHPHGANWGERTRGIDPLAGSKKDAAALKRAIEKYFTDEELRALTIVAMLTYDVVDGSGETPGNIRHNVTGSYRTSLMRHLEAAGITVREIAGGIEINVAQLHTFAESHMSLIERNDRFLQGRSSEDRNLLRNLTAVPFGDIMVDGVLAKRLQNLVEINEQSGKTMDMIRRLEREKLGIDHSGKRGGAGG